MKSWILLGAILFSLLLAIGFWLPLREIEQSQKSAPASLPEPFVITSKQSTPAATSPQAAVQPAAEELETAAETELQQLDPAAIASLRESMQQGDDRAPPVGQSVAPELPTEQELDSSDAYLGFEGRQDQKLKAAYLVAVEQEIPLLEAAIAEAKVQGLPAEQLAEGEEKLRRLRMTREQLIAQDPALRAVEGSDAF